MILNHDQLQVRAREFAMTHDLFSSRQRTTEFQARFRADMANLHEFADLLSEQRATCIQPAEDWLLDHIAFLEAQAQAVLRALPRTTLHQLPKLKDTATPRVYAICDDYLEHVGGRYDVRSFEVYVEAYQEISVLKLLECWILPAAFNVVIVRRLARAMQEVRYRHEVCKRVNTLFHKLTLRKMPEETVRRFLARETRERKLDTVEIVHLLRHLGEIEPDIQVVRDWISAYVETSESSLEHMVSYEHELQSRLQVTCGNLVTSLHVLERHPWQDTFAKISKVEAILSSGKDADYVRMDASSKELVRNRVAQVAARVNVPEILVANTAVEQVHRKQSREHSNKETIPDGDGSLAQYLFNPAGIALLRKQLAKVTRPRRIPEIAVRSRPMSVYLWSSTILFVVLMLGVGAILGNTGMSRASWAAIFLALALPVSEWTVTVVHKLITRCCEPRGMLRYDFSDGLPETARTMVVVPVIWSTVKEVDDVMERLLVHYFANRQQNIHFAVLADFHDAPAGTDARDADLINHAISCITDLRQKYGANRFFLFHRQRRYNPTDKVYMGWERKRGKLVEFVELLKGNSQTSFNTVVGETAILHNIRYVVTVDHDTLLPIGVVSRLAGTIHFPYNRPRLNADRTRVIDGYGVLQPRISVSFDSTRKSRFARLWASDPGIDPYAFAVSNPYQDLFGRGIFVGKGIFDVDVFKAVLVDRMPDNQILSHDVLEGGFLHAGLASDIEVVEEHPDTFYAHELRAHRWIRGDWQLISWLGAFHRDRQGVRRKNPLCLLTRWQIVDNLRRSLLDIVLLVVAMLGASVLPGPVGIWETTVLLTVFLPFVLSLVSLVLEGGSSHAVVTSFLQSAVRLCTLPFTAVLVADAILRTLYRMAISHRKMLEWETFAQIRRKRIYEKVFVYEPFGYLVSCVFITAAWLSNKPGHRIVGTIAVVLWVVARAIVQQLNKPDSDQKYKKWIETVRPQLQTLFRDIWAFYETYVSASESWLPPDNVQYHPREMIAHRTSPTNIGLYVACVVSARDLELISTREMMKRISAVLESVNHMEKWHGHLFNWYETRSLQPLQPKYVSTVDSGNFISYLLLVRQGLLEWSQRDMSWHDGLKKIAADIDKIVEQTNFAMLYNPRERLFSLGYHYDTDERDEVLYDLLASEARQVSFIAIALGQIPVSHWFTLGRTLTAVKGRKTLLSWSGTMFEYFMPTLIMKTYPGTLWDSTLRGVFLRQRTYAAAHGIPLGISESGYYAFDYDLNYQYRAFGVPGLGFDRGLAQNLVATPYAAILALPYARAIGMKALQQYENLGAKGKFGYLEAVDFTGKRLPARCRHKVIQSFMAHHQGMSMLAIANVLTNDLNVRRFHCDQRIMSANLLLQERIPERVALIDKPLPSKAPLPKFDDTNEVAQRTFEEPTSVPEVNVLSNGRLTSVSTNEGTGVLTWNGLAVTRWRDDAVIDKSGPVVYLHDVTSEDTWSVTNAPCAKLETSHALFKLHYSRFVGTYKGVFSQMDVSVSPDYDAEVRRIELRNDGTSERRIEVTSFVELVLASQAEDSAHPAFSKLFVQTMHDKEQHCLLAKRRTREEDEQETWAVHTLFVEGRETGDYEFETDRSSFIGRGYSLSEPEQLAKHLRASVGSVADPAFVMRRTVVLAAHEETVIYVVTGLATSRDGALDIVSHLKEPLQAENTLHLAWVRTQIDLHHLHLSPDEAMVANVLASRLLFTPPLDRTRRHAIEHNALGQSALWPHGISGDAPVMTVTLRHRADLHFVTVLARQHQYLRHRGITAELVVLDEQKGGYRDDFMNMLRDHLAARGIYEIEGIIVLKSQQLSLEERTLVLAVSRVVLRAGGPSLAAQLRVQEESWRSFAVPATGQNVDIVVPSAPETPISGEFYNGYGAFVDHGRAYQIRVSSENHLPRPWTNVLANPKFGCIITELGTGYSWWSNAREFKLTPWNNDPVLDPPGECLYLRDVENDDVWSAAPKPAGNRRAYTVTHGWGMTRIDQTEGDVTHSMEAIVPLDDPLKVMRLTLYNNTNQAKRIAITYYVEWVLGVSREKQAPYIVTAWDDTSSTLLARNTFQETFRDALAFVHITKHQTKTDANSTDDCSYTANRREFIGKGRTLRNPQAVYSPSLSGSVGSFANTCGAVQVTVELAPHSEEKISILLGCSTSKTEIRSLVEKYSDVAAYGTTRTAVTDYWLDITGAVTVRTPDRKLDILLNGWLLYQTLACRLWARTAFYQAGGATGFRDQLQDALALMHADSSITRKQILIHAAHQYEEGDVQHWWHEETKKGIRTRYSDDLLWLPYAVSRYVEHTGDSPILQEEIGFLHSPVLKDDELERYEDTVIGPERGTLLEHCLRSIQHAMRFGQHGLPKMGIGDWNDGMNRVGSKGRGESVWLGWFLLDILKRMVRLERHIVPNTEIQKFANTVHQLQSDINASAWDGTWFRRAFTDNGRWLGSIANEECRIDAIAQSWSVMSQGANYERQLQAMKSFDRELVDRELGLAKLLTKAFDTTEPTPGYIEGYPPGIRENGGQYTHGVIWSIAAWSLLHRRDRAHELFSMINPISHTETPHDVRTYGNEPYVMSADVYTAVPHQGQGGWSWYTGAAGWMYQAGLEYILGITRQGDKLYIRHCVPPDWTAYSVHYNYGASKYEIEVTCTPAESNFISLSIDGQRPRHQEYFTLIDDGEVHQIKIRMETSDSISTALGEQ